MKPDPITIYTLQFPDFGKVSRKRFLAIVHHHIFTFALKHQETIAQMGGCADYFHTQKNKPKTVPVLIHGLQKDGLVTVRAYTQKATDTLAIWYRMFKEKHPEYCTHVIKTTETYTPKQLKKPLVYKSTNWIPYRNLQESDSGYIDNDRGQSADFNTRIIGNVRTLTNNLYPATSDIHLEVDLKKVKTPHKSILALMTRHEDVLTPIYKYAFTVTLTTNVSLPSYFSLGQNVSYGNGIFERI